ncbi:hypothetical protein [Nocardia asteroides]|uniref:hypothetical protein n=1 Tax=Nocardia asteroides TaxID=1824 RepID=UPI001E333122|nr:hypothetical protein [Nocardia asteroides]UGT64430.1 hypothetical protein LTT61_14565 [Nocardia asteroides]
MDSSSDTASDNAIMPPRTDKQNDRNLSPHPRGSALCIAAPDIGSAKALLCYRIRPLDADQACRRIAVDPLQFVAVLASPREPIFESRNRTEGKQTKTDDCSPADEVSQRVQ